MYMKTHILAALREEFEHWERVLAGLSEAQIHAVPQSGDLSVKDELTHLWAWQQRSIARMEAGLNNTEPKMPQWLPGVSPEDEENTDQINAHIYTSFKDRSWTEVHRQWREGFLQFIELGQATSEPALLDASRYAWLGGYSLAAVLIGSYDHHQEHLDKLLAQLQQRNMTMAKSTTQSSAFPKTSAPALRALTAAGYHTLADLTQVSEADLAKLHGMGPKALGILRDALAAKGLTFANEAA